MSRVLTFLFLCLACTTTLWGQQETVDRPTESAAKAQELWEKAIAAKGGRERLHAVQNMVITHRATYAFPQWREKADAQYVYFYAFPDKSWEWIDSRPSRFGLRVRMYNGTQQKSWLAYESEPSARELSVSPGGSDERFDLLRDQLLYLMESQWVKPVPTRATTERLGSKTVNVVRAIVENYVVYYYLDQQTHLPLRVDIREADRDHNGRELFSDVLSDYTDVAGLQLPGKAGERQLTYEINVDYDPEVFEQPPSIAAGPEGWRRRTSW